MISLALSLYLSTGEWPLPVRTARAILSAARPLWPSYARHQRRGPTAAIRDKPLPQSRAIAKWVITGSGEEHCTQVLLSPNQRQPRTNDWKCYRTASLKSIASLFDFEPTTRDACQFHSSGANYMHRDRRRRYRPQQCKNPT